MKLDLRTRKLKDVRNDVKIPGVMYGKSIDSTSIEVDDKAFKEALKTYGKSRTFQVTLDNKKHTVYIKNVQTHILKPDHIIHFDLHRLSKDEKLTATIPLVFEGKDELSKKRLYVQANVEGILSEYAPGSGVDHFTFDVTALEAGYSLTAKDLDVPEGLKVLHDPNDVIFSIKESTMKEEVTESTDDEADVLSDDAQEQEDSETSEV